MGKFKLAKRNAKAPPARGAVPCILVLVSGMVLLLLLFYYMLKPS